MLKTGHIGVNQIIYAPILTAMLAAGQPILALYGLILMVSLATFPDNDIVLPIPHRGPTHSIWFALLVGLVVGLISTHIAFLFLAPVSVVFWFGFIVGTAAILGHIMGDYLTPMGIKPLTIWPFHNIWPFSKFSKKFGTEKRYSVDITKASNPISNVLLAMLGMILTGGAVVVYFEYLNGSLQDLLFFL